MRDPSPVAILLFALSSSRLGSQELLQRELAYKGCYALTAAGLPRQIEFTIVPKKDAEGHLSGGSTRPIWRLVRIIQPAEPHLYGGSWGWRLVRDGHVEMLWNVGFGYTDITLNGGPKVLVGTAKYTSDDFSVSPAVPIRAERIACGTPSPQ